MYNAKWNFRKETENQDAELGSVLKFDTKGTSYKRKNWKMDFIKIKNLALWKTLWEDKKIKYIVRENICKTSLQQRTSI